MESTIGRLRCNQKYILVADAYVSSSEETLEHKSNKTKTRNIHAGARANPGAHAQKIGLISDEKKSL